MQRTFKLALAAVALGLFAGTATAQTVKIGVIGPMSGPFALYGKNFHVGIDAYQAEHGTSIAGHPVEFIYRDLDKPDPAKAKAIAQELVVKDGVQYLAGVYFTPNAMAIAPVLEEAQVPLIVMNAATSAITDKSPYIVRTSFTMWQNTVPAAKVAAARGAKKALVAVSDYGPGIDAETAFKKTFEAAGGSVVDAIRMPLATADFGPIMQRIKDSGADTVFTFLPSGPPTLGFMKAFIDNGLKGSGVRLITTGDVVPEPDLATLGDAAIGTLSTFHYAPSHDSAENRQFLADVAKAGGKVDELTMTAVAAFDGMAVIAKMIEATGGKPDPAAAIAAVKGYAWVSPRGPVSIDPATRHITQNIYLREVAKVDGKLINREIETFANQPDSGAVAK